MAFDHTPTAGADWHPTHNAATQTAGKMRLLILIAFTVFQFRDLTFFPAKRSGKRHGHGPKEKKHSIHGRSIRLFFMAPQMCCIKSICRHPIPTSAIRDQVSQGPRTTPASDGRFQDLAMNPSAA